MSQEGRAPRPAGGDPNIKRVLLELTPEDWRRLRVWAAEELLTQDELIARLLRERLQERPATSYHGVA